MTLKKLKRFAALAVLAAAVCAVLSCCREKQNDGTDERDPRSAQFTLDEIREEAKSIKKDYPNIDFSTAEITIPDADGIELWESLSDTDIAASMEVRERVFNTFFNCIKLATGRDEVDKSKIYFIWHAKWIPFESLTEEDIQNTYLTAIETPEDGKEAELAPGYGGYSLEYRTPECTVITQHDDQYWIEKSRCFEYYNSSEERGANLIPNDVIATYDLERDSIEDVSYEVDGEPFALKDAVEFVNEHFKEEYEDYNCICSPFLDYKVFKVEVVKDEGRYYYFMWLKKTYNGIDLAYEQGSPDGSWLDAAMLTHDSIDYAMTPYGFETKNEGKFYDRFISLEGAMDILSETFSSHLNLTCDSVKVVYGNHLMSHKVEGAADGRPEIDDGIGVDAVYEFKFSNTGLPDYPYLIADVNMLTGKVTTGSGFWALSSP